MPWIGAVGGVLGAGGMSMEEPLIRKSHGFRAAVRKRVRLVVRLRLGYESSTGESRDKAVVVHCCLYIHYYPATLVGRALSSSAVFICCLPFVPLFGPKPPDRGASGNAESQRGVAKWSRNMEFGKWARTSTCSPLTLRPHASAETELYSRKQWTRKWNAEPSERPDLCGTVRS